jgi:hypothetical protein
LRKKERDFNRLESERDFNRLEKKPKRRWDYDIIERVKEREREAWGSVSGFGYVDVVCWMQV